MGERRVTGGILRAHQMIEIYFQRFRVSAWVAIFSRVLVEENRHAAPLIVSNWLLVLEDVE